MSTEQMKAEFENWWTAPEQHELRISCAKGWGFKIWTASREALVVSLPKVNNWEEKLYRRDVVDELISVGITVRDE